MPGDDHGWIISVVFDPKCPSPILDISPPLGSEAPCNFCPKCVDSVMTQQDWPQTMGFRWYNISGMLQWEVLWRGRWVPFVLELSWSVPS